MKIKKNSNCQAKIKMLYLILFIGRYTVDSSIIVKYYLLNIYLALTRSVNYYFLQLLYC